MKTHPRWMRLHNSFMAESILAFIPPNTLDVSNIIPRGIITMWSGAASNIPSGWTIYNGANGTPNLRDRFVIAAGAVYGVGYVGGSETHTLTINEMPQHNHTINCASPYQGTTKNLMLRVDSRMDSDSSSIWDTGGNQPHNNMPPYYALCFIMKL